MSTILAQDVDSTAAVGTPDGISRSRGLPGAEPIVKEILTLLKSGMRAALAALGTVDGVTVALPAPDADTGFWGYLTDPALLPTYPAMILRRGPRHTVGERAVNEEYHIDNHIAVDIVVFGSDNATLTLQMDRYIRAVCAILTATNALVCGDCELMRVGYEEPQLYDRESGDYLQDVPVFFIVTTYETP